MPGKALLIIDMQRGDFPPIKPRFKAKEVIARINEIAEAFREQQDLVIYVQHDGSAEGAFVPGTTDWEILPQLKQASADMLVSKTANNAFYNSRLLSVLKEAGTEQLFITGSATDFCVNATVQAALALDYQVSVFKNAHTTADRPNLTAQQVIDHYNWVWQNMTPTKGNITVIDF
jgi:nicotinamidase-related amidase